MTNKKLLRINKSRIKRGEEPLERHKKYIYRRFSYIGKRNYISYALRAASIMKEPSIKQQIKPHWLKIKKNIRKYDVINKEYHLAESIISK